MERSSSPKHVPYFCTCQHRPDLDARFCSRERAVVRLKFDVPASPLRRRSRRKLPAEAPGHLAAAFPLT